MSDKLIDVALREAKERVESVLDRWLPDETEPPSRLHRAMRYSCLSGGKRFRPLLVYATADALQIAKERVDALACAVEMIHAYSLIHDDLPAMDDDDLRRGQPTCHRAFDEATAILAGDALQAVAFKVLVSDPEITEDANIRLEIIDTLVHASGSRGMAGGQMIDLEAVGCELSVAELERMHLMKTGALIQASVDLVALAKRDLPPSIRQGLNAYAKNLGLAFQIRDDILDLIADTETLGKTQGADLAREKPTYVSILGLDGARERARALHEEALSALNPLGDRAALLREIAGYVVERAF